MNLAAAAPDWLALFLVGLLLAAAIEDAARLRISNLTTGLVLVGGILAALVVGPGASLWQNLLVLAGLVLVLLPLFATGRFGGGDVKLLAATGFWFDLAGALHLLIAVFLAGGALALVVIAARLVRGRGLRRTGGGIPYGIAIAAGALFVIWTQRS